MLCMGECACPKLENRQAGFFERMFQKRSSWIGTDDSSREVPGLVHLSRSGKAELHRGELCVVAMSRQCQVCCTEGVAWVTFPGRFSDYILKAGESLFLQGKGKIIISGGSANSIVRVCNG